jgi:hypothetical protein
MVALEDAKSFAEKVGLVESFGLLAFNAVIVHGQRGSVRIERYPRKTKLLTCASPWQLAL